MVVGQPIEYAFLVKDVGTGETSHLLSQRNFLQTNTTFPIVWIDQIFRFHANIWELPYCSCRSWWCAPAITILFRRLSLTWCRPLPPSSHWTFRPSPLISRWHRSKTSRPLIRRVCFREIGEIINEVFHVAIQEILEICEPREACMLGALPHRCNRKNNGRCLPTQTRQDH